VAVGEGIALRSAGIGKDVGQAYLLGEGIGSQTALPHGDAHPTRRRA
jgi:hypothetical protein